MTKNKAAQELGRLGGLSKSADKAAAARENGAKGGRPVGVKDSKPRKKVDTATKEQRIANLEKARAAKAVKKENK